MICIFLHGEGGVVDVLVDVPVITGLGCPCMLFFLIWCLKYHFIIRIVHGGVLRAMVIMLNLGGQIRRK